jgi:iron complex transport system permease protein
VPPLTARRLAGSLSALLLLLTAAATLAVSVGSSGLTLLDLARVADGPATADPEVLRATILRVRLPRVLMAVLAGGALGAAGAVFQALLRNPLADPYVLGISGGAALGYIAAAAAGLHALLPVLPVREAAAFGGALLTVFLIFVLSSVHGRPASYRMLLIGVVLNTIYLALILFIQTVIGVERLHGVLLWMIGNVPSAGYGVIASLALLLTAGVATLAVFGRDLNVMSAGEEAARSLGVEVERIRAFLLVVASLVTAAVVSFTGLIGFVGLIVPHAARLVFGPDHRLSVPAAALAGGLFLLAADTLARTLLAPTELPVGVLTALAGGPFFIWLYRAQGGTRHFD